MALKGHCDKNKTWRSPKRLHPQMKERQTRHRSASKGCANKMESLCGSRKAAMTNKGNARPQKAVATKPKHHAAPKGCTHKAESWRGPKKAMTTNKSNAQPRGCCHHKAKHHAAPKGRFNKWNHHAAQKVVTTNKTTHRPEKAAVTKTKHLHSPKRPCLQSGSIVRTKKGLDNKQSDARSRKATAT